jgi:hypothetical protein
MLNFLRTSLYSQQLGEVSTLKKVVFCVSITGRLTSLFSTFAMPPAIG